MPSKVIGIAIGPDDVNGKRIVRQSVQQAELKVGHGIVGDRKAGRSNREVNVIHQASYDWFARNNTLGRTMPGGFGENIVIDGDIDLLWLNDDAELKIGEVTLRMLWPRTPCEIMKTTAGLDRVERLNGRVGVFCAVTTGGIINVGDEVTIAE